MCACLRVLIAALLGEGENDEEDLFRAAVPGSVVRLSVELQTPGLPEGQEEGRLAFSPRPPSALPSLFCSTSLSLSLSR